MRSQAQQQLQLPAPAVGLQARTYEVERLHGCGAPRRGPQAVGVMGMTGYEEATMRQGKRLVNREQREIADGPNPCAVISRKERQRAILNEPKAMSLTKAADWLEWLSEPEVMDYVQRRNSLIQSTVDVCEIDLQAVVEPVVAQAVARHKQRFDLYPLMIGRYEYRTASRKVEVR